MVNQQKPFVSLVIPCYNCFDKMDKLLSSLESQTDKDFEAIFIDDCSTDGTFMRLSEYADKSSLNMTVVKNDVNSGPGVTRNNGIKLVNGEYVTFVDSDDYVSDSSIELWREVLSSDKDIDCLAFDYYIVKGESEIYQKIYHGNLDTDERIARLDEKKSIVYIAGATWCKVYRTDMIKDNNVKFLNLMRNEDMPFTKCALKYSQKTVYLREALYYYVMQPGSLTHNDSLRNSKNTVIGFDAVENGLRETHYSECEAIFAIELYTMVQNMISEKAKRSDIILCIKDGERRFPTIWKNEYLSEYPKKYKIAFFLIKNKLVLGLRAIYKVAKLRRKI